MWSPFVVSGLAGGGRGAVGRHGSTGLSAVRASRLHDLLDRAGIYRTAF